MKITFRTLARTDFEQVAHWLAQPHVAKWWRDPAPTVAAVEEEYGANVDGDLKTRVYIAEADGRDIGLIQCFWMADYPEYDELFAMPDMASIDYLIGEPDYVGRGVGTAVIGQFIDTVVRSYYPEAAGVVTSVEVENAPSLGALRKNGFEPGAIITGDYGTPECVMVRRFRRQAESL